MGYTLWCRHSIYGMRWCDVESITLSNIHFFTVQPVEAIYHLLQKNKKTLWLGVLTILKNMSSSMGRIIPYIYIYIYYGQ